MFAGRLVSRIFEEFQQPAIQNKIVQHFGRFFQYIKVRQQIGIQFSIQSACQRSNPCSSIYNISISNGNDIEAKQNEASILRHLLYRSETKKLILKGTQA
jgi:hypothetical protein